MLFPRSTRAALPVRRSGSETLLTIFYHAFWFTVGSVAWVTGTFHLTKSNDVNSALQSLGEIVMGAALVTYIFGFFKDRQTNVWMESMIAKQLRASVITVEDAFGDRCIRDYSWDCSLTVYSTPSSVKTPKRLFSSSPLDLSREYVRQMVRVSYHVSELPTKLKFIASISDNDIEGPSGERADDVFLNWEIDTLRRELNIFDNMVFHLTDVSLDNVRLPIDEKALSKGANQIREFSCVVPTELRSVGANLSFAFISAKLMSNPIILRSRLFRPALTGRMRITVDPRLPVNRLEFTSQITPLKPGLARIIHGHTFVRGSQLPSYECRAFDPMLEGSSWDFYVFTNN